MNFPLRRSLSLLLILVLTSSIACKKEDDSESMNMMILAVSLVSFLNPAYQNSCNVTSGFRCENSYRTAVSSASCTGSGGTLQTTKCATTQGANTLLGACRINDTETVRYTGGGTCTTVNGCQTQCTSLGGTFNAGYTP